MKPFFYFGLVLTLLSFSLAHADEPTAGEVKVLKQPLSFHAQVSPEKVAAGSNANLVIDIKAAEHYHAYEESFKIQWTEEPEIKMGALQISPLVKFFDPVSKKDKMGVEGKATLSALIEIPESFAQKEVKTKLKISYQACTAKFCLLPTFVEVPVKFTVTNLEKSLEYKKSGSITSLSFEEALQKGRLFLYLFAFLAGVLTSFTPCVFPMIPITLAVIGSHSRGKEKSSATLRSFSLSVFYVLGIALTYSVLGVVAAKSGMLFGSLLSNKIVAFSIAGLFVAMGLSMYGLFEIQLPSFIRNHMANVKTEQDFLGAFLTGLITGIVASPCVGPVLVGILAHVARTQDLFLGFTLLFAFAMGMGLLFIVLGTFSSLINLLPKAGEWMNFIKFIFGSSMIAMAIYYLSPVVSDAAYFGLLGVTIVCISSAFGAFDPQPHNTLRKIRKGTMLALFFVGIFYLAKAVLPEFLNTGAQVTGSIVTGSETVVTNGSVSAEVIVNSATQKNARLQEHLIWAPYTKESLKKAAAEGRPVIINFHAQWCSACKELEKHTFTNPQVIELSKSFLLLTVDATDSSQFIDQVTSEYNVIGLPTLIFFNARGEKMNSLTLTGFENADRFSARLKKVLKP